MLYLEMLETCPNPIQEPYEMWHQQMVGMAMGKYPQRILAHSRQSDSAQSHNEWGTCKTGLSFTNRHLYQIASQLENRRMPNGTYGGVRGRKTKVGRKLLRFPPTRLRSAWALSNGCKSLSHPDSGKATAQDTQLASLVIGLLIHRPKD